jgi:N-acyl-D-aspartate/D-glutamate deacylase
VVDGTGGAARHADVAIDDGVVTEVGDDVGAAARTIDADGRLVTPGFVDIHTHYDGQVTWDPYVTPSGWHGVTTVVMGNCGVGFAPAHADKREWLIELMEGVEDIPGTALAEGMSWNWETFPEYLDEVASMPRGMDVAAQIPHGALRAYVMGDRGAHNEPATPEDIAEMARLVREGLEAGAVGVSTTRTVLHRAKNGELAAGTTALPDELLGIGDAMGAVGHGVFEVADDLVDPEAEFAWMTELSLRSGRPVTFACLQNELVPDAWRDQLRRTEEANAAGARLVPQVAGRPACLLFGWESTAHPFLFNRAYQKVAALPLAERVAQLRTAELRNAILAETEQTDVFLAHVLAAWDRIFPLGDPPDYEPGPDRSVAAMAAREGRAAAEVTYDLMLERNGHALLYRPLLGYADLDFGALREMLLHPDAVLGLGDGGAHCGILCDASLPTFMLSHWVRDRDRGERLGLEQAVHFQTQRTARLYGMEDRGVLAPGYRADLNVIDLDALGMAAPEMVYDLPANGRRLIQRSHGYAATVTAGEPVFIDGEPTGALPGRLVRGPQAAPA